MKILLIDATSGFLDFALRCEAAGHEVRVFQGPTAKGEKSLVGKGLLTIVEDWKPSMKWADLICTSDNTKYIKELEGFRQRGFPLWAPNLCVTEWELNRGIGQRVLEEVGVDCIPSFTFSNYDEAINFQLKNLDLRFVCKPTGDADKALSYVSKSFKDMVFMLEHWKRTQKKKVPFLLQEFIPGIEMAVGGWMGRDGFLSYFLENFEFKKLMPGEIGVNTGEMGTAMKYVPLGESKLAQMMLMPLEAELIRQGYTGYIDVAVIIDEEGTPYPLEFTSRPGWPLFQIQQVLHPDPCGWMKDALEGRDTFVPCEEVAVGVVVALPDFPYSRLTKKLVAGFPVWGITDENRYHIHPGEMMLGEGRNEKGKVEPMMVSAGDYLLVASGIGEGVEEAKECAYAVVKQLEVPNSPMYRNDIGCRLEEQLPKLQSMGFATDWSW